MAKAFLVAGMAFGDESKGQTTEYLARKNGASLVIRYNGGSQALHHVVQADGRVHGFSQFGSGSFIPGVKTHLSRFMLVNPLSQITEEAHLRELGIADMWERTTVHEDCVIITPIHKAANRLKELARGSKRHGSCGVGVGVAREDSINNGNELLHARDIRDKQGMIRHKLWKTQIRHQHLLENLDWSVIEHGDFTDAASWLTDMTRIEELAELYKEWPAKIVDHFTPEECMVFEGAQGVLLDETHGHLPPHVTWTNTTFDNAYTLLHEAGYDGEITRVGCFRTYFTRHGAGPFPTEVPGSEIPEPHNKYGEYQGDWRIGSFDFELAKYALKVTGGVDYISMSHFDVADPDICRVERELGVKIGLKSYGPTYEDRVEIL